MAAPDEEAGGGGDDGDGGHIVVRVATAQGSRQVTQRDVQLPSGARLRDAIAALGSDAVSAEFVAGVWGRVRPMDWVLHDGDRIELSRALKLDPMEARRLRHQHQKALPKPRRLSKAETQG